MTRSARSSSDCETARPSAFAVFMLTTSSNLLGCSTGRSAGAAPLRVPGRIVGGSTHDVVDVLAERHESASLSIGWTLEARWQPVSQGQFRETLSLREERRRAENQDRVGALSRSSLERALEVVEDAHLHEDNTELQRLRCLLHDPQRSAARGRCQRTATRLTLGRALSQQVEAFGGQLDGQAQHR